MDLQKVYREKQQMQGNTAREELESLRSEVAGRQKEAAAMQEAISNLEKKNALLTEAGRKLLAENRKLKRQLEEAGNDLPNSSLKDSTYRGKSGQILLFRIILVIETLGWLIMIASIYVF
jgi:predicted nuclease with TOPRIM domain